MEAISEECHRMMFLKWGSKFCKMIIKHITGSFCMASALFTFLDDTFTPSLIHSCRPITTWPGSLQNVKHYIEDSSNYNFRPVQLQMVRDVHPVEITPTTPYHQYHWIYHDHILCLCVCVVSKHMRAMTHSPEEQMEFLFQNRIVFMNVFNH